MCVCGGGGGGGEIIYLSLLRHRYHQKSELRNCVKVEVAVLLKGRQSLDKNLLKNYRPTSICPKSLEKSFSTKLLSHLQESNPAFQSTYRGYRTDTALLRKRYSLRSGQSWHLFFSSRIFLQLLTLMTTKFSSPAWTPCACWVYLCNRSE